MISKNSPRKKEALELARFFQREEMQKVMFELGGYIPTNAEVYKDTAYISSHPPLSYYAMLIQSGFHRPSLVEYTKMSDIVSRAVHKAIKGEMSVDKALHEAAVEIRLAGATH